MTDAQSERSSMSHNGSKPPTDELNQHGKRVQELIVEIDTLPDSNVRELLQDACRKCWLSMGSAWTACSKSPGA